MLFIGHLWSQHRWRGNYQRHRRDRNTLDKVKYSVMYPGQVKYSEFSRPSNPQGNITVKGEISSCRKALPVDERLILYDPQLSHWKQTARCKLYFSASLPPTHSHLTQNVFGTDSSTIKYKERHDPNLLQIYVRLRKEVNTLKVRQHWENLQSPLAPQWQVKARLRQNFEIKSLYLSRYQSTSGISSISIAWELLRPTRWILLD